MTLAGDIVLPRISSQGRPWWRDPFRVFQTNLREVDATLDVGRTLDAIEAHGANVWLINGGGIMSYYPSDLSHQTRNPYLAGRASGDLLGDAVGAAHRRGIRVITRMDFSKVSERVAREHPEWLYVDPQGEFQIYQGLYSTCPSADYYQAAAFEVLSEVANRYPVDGFFFNWFGFNEVDYSGRYRGVSQNASSKRRFSEWSGGQSLPANPDSPGYLAWTRFATETISDLTHRFREHIASVLPGAAFIRGPGADVVFHEANNALGRANWPFATSEAVSAITSPRSRTPTFVNSVAFVDMPYRLAAEEPGRYEQYIAQTLARGGNPSVYIMGEPGDIDYPNVTAVSPLFRFHRDNAAEYADAVSAADVAVVRPGKLRLGAAYAEAEKEFRGVYRALQQRHVPFDVVPYDESSLDSGLDAYRVVVLPDCGTVDDESIEVLNSAIERGTVVIMTGSSGVGSTPLAYTPVSRYADAIQGTELHATYAVRGSRGSHPRHPVVPVYGTFYPISVEYGTDATMSLVPPVAYGPPEKAHGNVVSDDPAVAIHRAPGGGGVMVVPWTIGRTFHELGLTVTRDLLADAVEAELGDRIAFDLPEHVEVTLLSVADDLLVHIVNASGAQGNGFAPPIPVRDGTMHVPFAVRAVDVRTGARLPTDSTDTGVRVELPEIGALAVVRLSPRPGKQPTEETA